MLPLKLGTRLPLASTAFTTGCVPSGCPLTEVAGCVPKISLVAAGGAMPKLLTLIWLAKYGPPMPYGSVPKSAVLAAVLSQLAAAARL